MRSLLGDLAMLIPIGTRTSAAHRDTVAFRCVHCGHRARAEVLGIGEGMASVLNAPGTGRRRAAADARVDVQRTIARAKCPTCRRRDPRGVWKFAQPYAISAAFFVVVGIVAGFGPTWFQLNMRADDKALCATWAPLIVLATMLVAIVIPMWLRWRATDGRIRWL